MEFSTIISSRTYRFGSLCSLMAKATPRRSGDELAGIAATSEAERVAAQMALADVPLKHFLNEDVLQIDDDDVTRIIQRNFDPQSFKEVASLTVGEFREFLLDYGTDAERLKKLAPGLLPEMVAAVSKIMRNQDLILAAHKCRVTTTFRNTQGLPGRLGVRLQPNHPTDDPAGIAASIFDGLMYGIGDAVIGINPATDSPASLGKLLRILDGLIAKLQIPSQSCVLTHVSSQLEAINAGAPVDLVFQSIAGTQKANDSFGFTLDMLREAQQAALSLKRGMPGSQVMYFETGQGSCLSADSSFGVDQQTLEARAYGLARCFDPFLVNSVVGFIGPEYLFDARQITRAGLEDHFCGKVLGLPMGCDICYTNHADADQDDMDNLLTLLATAGVNFVMGVPGADNIMLNYQSTSFHDANFIRQLLGLRPAPEFEGWLNQMRIQDDNGRLLAGSPAFQKHLLREFNL